MLIQDRINKERDLLLLVGSASIGLLAVANEGSNTRTLGALELEQLVSLVPRLTVRLRDLLYIKQVAHCAHLLFLLPVELADVVRRELALSTGRSHFLRVRLAQGVPRRHVPSATVPLLPQSILDALKPSLRAAHVRVAREHLAALFRIPLAHPGPLLLLTLNCFMLGYECCNDQQRISTMPRRHS